MDSTRKCCGEVPGDAPSLVIEAAYPVSKSVNSVSEALLSVSEAFSSQFTSSNVNQGRTWVLMKN